MNPLLKRLTLISLPIAGIILGIFYFSVTGVEIAQATKETATHAIPGNLRVVPTEWSVRLQASGTVLSNEIKVGDKVEAGQLLLELDTSDIETELTLARKSLDVATKKRKLPSNHQLLLNIEILNLDKLKNSVERGVSSSIDLERQQKRVDNLKELANLDALGLELAEAQARTHLTRLETNHSRCFVKAPVTGVVTFSWILKGSYAVHNTEAFRIQSDEKIVEVRINEDDFYGVKEEVPAKVRFYSYGHRIFSGKVSKILPEADPSTQEYTVNLDVDMGGEPLYAGMSGEASIVLGVAPESTVIPRRALMGNRVFIVKDGRVEQREVQVGFRGLNKLQILEGLQPGDKVVVENLDMVRSGGRVRIKK
ncbi:MAG: efflux RND transporter periplasmic adaptor subunit [Opitutae bacterium]|nr:efflux RND transporter periplasmic adaptor subunit [Opitutae bacterium]MBT6462934.1 efflux RND transporter periplasmic adaptor subunit [Opitutae bacterium]MBT6957662.1 efflux RND transporter periplasmic adaptor subunit [Opitutae bacterium]MBT7854235.1 efflux RND transporter periplasmic adaptor subunit [Opitutae bacterium]